MQATGHLKLYEHVIVSFVAHSIKHSLCLIELFYGRKQFWIREKEDEIVLVKEYQLL